MSLSEKGLGGKGASAEVLDEAGLDDLQAEYIEEQQADAPDLEGETVVDGEYIDQEAEREAQEMRDELAATLGIAWQAVHGMFRNFCAEYAGRMPAPLPDEKADGLGQKTMRVISHYWRGAGIMETPLGSLIVGVGDSFGKTLIDGEPLKKDGDK